MGSCLTVWAVSIAAILAVVTVAQARADGDDAWTTLNTTPFGPSELAIDPGSPGNVYATGPRLTLMSRDGGGEWSLADDVPPQTDRLIFDPLTPSITFALVDGQLLQRTSVEPWKRLAPGILEGLEGFTINADNPNQLWAVTSSSLLRSEDGGSSWTKSSLAISGDVTSFAIGWPDSLHVYVALDRFGLFHSIDGGATWSDSGAGLENAGSIHAIQVDGLVAGTLYAATNAGLYRSPDHGSNWIPLETPNPYYGTGLLLWTNTNGGTLYTAAGDVLYHSEDMGVTWQATQPAMGWSISRLVAEPENPSVMYVIAAGAVLKTFDAGINWTPPQQQDGYRVIAAHPTTGGLLLANRVDFGGGHRSTDGGRTWTAMADGWPNGADIGAFHMHASVPDLMFAAAGHALFTSGNAGKSWASTGMPTSSTPLAIRTAPSDPNVILVAVGQAILRSSDGGSFWESAELPGYAQADDLWMAPEDATEAVAATDHGLYHSTDGGASWKMAGGVGAAAYHDLWSGAKPGEVYATTDTGFVSSNDSGASWTNRPPAVGLSSKPIRFLRDWGDPNVFYAVLVDRFLISPNAGLHWMPLGGDLAFSPSYLVAEGVTTRQLYADDYQGRNQWRLTLLAIPPAPTPTPAPTVTPALTFAPPTVTLSPTTTPTPRLVFRLIGETSGAEQQSPWALVLGGVALAALLGAGVVLIARRRARRTTGKEG